MTLVSQVVDVKGKGMLGAEAMVFVSGRSGAHLRRMADVLVIAVSGWGRQRSTSCSAVATGGMGH